MNGSRFFWGIIIFLLGGLILLSNFNLIPAGTLGNIWQLWPLLLVLWGVSILIGRREKRSYLLAVVILIMIVIGAGLLWWNRGNLSGVLNTTQISEEIGNIKTADLSIKFGAAALTLNGGGDKTVSGVASAAGNIKITENKTGDSDKIEINQVTNGIGFLNNSSNNKLDLKLSNIVMYNLSLDTGASKFDLNLGEVMVKSLNINCGASNGTITLGDKIDLSDLTISSGASSFVINVPKDSALKIHDDSGLSGNNFADIGLTKNGRDYTSQDYNNSLNKINFTFKSGASSVKIVTY